VPVMPRKAFTNLYVFLIAFAIISLSADICFLGRNTSGEPGMEGWEGMPDFKVFWVSARNLDYRMSPAAQDPSVKSTLQRKYPVYDKNERFYHFRYSPFMALALIPIGRITYPAMALFLWSIFCNIIFLSAVLLLTRRLSRDFNAPDTHRYIILWGAFLATARYYLMILGQGQTDALVAFLFVVFLLAYLDKKEILCGVILALILQMKLLFLPLLLYFLVRGRIKLLTSTIVSFFALLFLPACFIGLSETMALLKNWMDILSMTVTSQLLNLKNQSIAYGISVLLLKNSYIKENVRPEYLIYPLSGLFTLFSYMAILWFRRSARNTNEIKHDYIEISMLLIVSLLFAPTSWEAYYVNLIIPLAITILFTLRSRKRGLLCAAMGMYFILSCAIGTDLTKYIPGVNSFRFINISLGTIFLLFAMIYSYIKNIGQSGNTPYNSSSLFQEPVKP